MSRTYHHGKYSIKEQVRYRKLGRAVICLANAEQEKEAKLEHDIQSRRKSKQNRKKKL
jgi:hypothetical protein